MDPQIILIGVAVFVISALLIYLISVFGIKEKSYEEAIAEQKRRIEEEKEKARSEKRAEKEKKKYRKGKEKPKEKEKSAQVSEPEFKEAKMVNLEIDPEIIEPLDSSPERKHSKSKRHDKLKPILSNKDEKPVVAKTTQEVIHHKLPKDEVELKHEHDREVKEKKSPSKPSKVSAEKEKPKHVREPVQQVEEEIIVEKQVKVQSAPLQFEERRSTGTKAGNASQLFTSVRGASLTDGEVQTLIDILLDKQGAGSSVAVEWNKKSQKGDPVALLRKQLEEKERALQEEQQLAMSANNKCKELKIKMSEEKARYGSMEKQYQAKLASQNDEIQALHSRMQNAHDQHMIEASNMQARLQQLQQQVGDGGRLHQLNEENKLLKESLERTKAEAIPPAEFNSLRQKVSIMENELSNNVIKLNASEKSRRNLESRTAKYEEELKKYKNVEKEDEGMWSKRVDEMGQQLRKAENEKATLTTNLQAAEKECMTVKNKLKELEKALSGNDTTSKELEEKLKGTEKELSSLKTNMKTVEKKLADSEKQKSEVQNELEVLKKENQALSTEVKTARERHVGEGQERGKAVGAPNGDINGDKTENTVSVVEHEKLKSDIESRKSEVLTLQKEIDTYKMDLVRAEAEIQNFKLEITNIQEQLETQKKKNNELREKNWKAMDALDKAEKSVSDKVQTATKGAKEDSAKLVSEMEKYDKSVLQKIFPEVSVSEKLVHKEWMSSFEKEAITYISTLSKKVQESSASSDTKAKELQKNYNQLETQLKDQQSMCLKLQTQLQDSQNQTTQLQAKQKDLQASSSQLQTKLTEQQNTNTKLQSQLQESQNQTTQLQAKQKELQTNNSQLQSQLEAQKKLSPEGGKSEAKINELQDKNNKLQSQNSSLESRVTELEENNRKLQLDVENKKTSSASDSKVQELEDTNSKLQSQLDEYRNVLATTETKLQQLENSVEGEEKKWQEKLQTAQLDLEQSRQEALSVKQELQKLGGSSEALTELDFAYRCVEKSLVEITDEMKEKVSSLETQLKTAEERTVQLEKQVEEKTEIISTMQIKVIETEKSTGDLDDLLRQIAELKKNVEEEKKKSKELASTNVKLNGIIKTGHDALTQEQKMVLKLKEQLQDKNKDSGTPVQGVEELKAKLAETEKQLERELTNNKQLTQRLAASQGNDAGTSV